MSKILEQATAHFREKISAEMKYVIVPEWGNQKVYFKNVITLKEQSKLIELASQGKQVEALVESLIVKARNEDGTKMFTMMDKPTLMNEVDPNILIQLVSEINTATETESDMEAIEKN